MENEEKDYAMAKKEHDEEEGIISRCLKDDSYAKELQDYEYAERIRNEENRHALIKEKNDAIDLAADEKVHCAMCITYIRFALCCVMLSCIILYYIVLFSVMSYYIML